MNSGHRATEFTRICRHAGFVGVTLHSYRYAWAERAKPCGYPERFVQEVQGVPGGRPEHDEPGFGDVGEGRV